MAVDQMEHEQILPRAGWVEHDPVEVWNNTREVIGGALGRGNLSSGHIQALGITNQRETTVVWDRATGPATHFEFQHAEVHAPIMLRSPFASMLRDGVDEVRRDLTKPDGEDEWPVFAELREAGMTDWLGRVFPFGELTPRVPGPADTESAAQLWVVF